MKYNLIVLAFIFLVSCRQDKNKQGVDISLLEHSTPTEELTLSMLTDNVEMVALMTSPESLIKFPKKIQVSGNHIFVLSGNEILVFGTNGEFLRKIGTPGRGPGEFKFVNDFAISDKGIMVILEGKPQVIYIYNQDGEQLKKIEAHPKALSLTIHKQCIVVHNGNTELNEEISFTGYNLDGEQLFTRANSITFSGPKIGIYGFVSECNFFVLKGDLYAKELHCDTVQRFTGSGFEPGFQLNSNGKAYLPQHRADFRQYDIADYLYVRNLLSSQGLVMVIFQYHKSSNILIFDSELSLLRSYSFSNGIYDDLVTGRAIKTINQAGDGRLYFLINAHEIVNNLGKGFDIAEISSRVGRAIKIDDNPIVVFFTPDKIVSNN